MGAHGLTPAYDLITSVTGFGKGYKRRVLHSIHLTGHETLLDVGCGTGVLVELIKREHPGIYVIGIDPDRPALEIARKRLERAGQSAELKLAFAEALPLADQSVDAAFSTLAFHHMDSRAKEQACMELFRVLKTGGRTVISDFNRPKILGRTKAGAPVVETPLRGYLEQAGFHPVRLLWTKFPWIQTLVADKSSTHKNQGAPATR